MPLSTLFVWWFLLCNDLDQHIINTFSVYIGVERLQLKMLIKALVERHFRMYIYICVCVCVYRYVFIKIELPTAIIWQKNVAWIVHTIGFVCGDLLIAENMLHVRQW